MINVSQQGRINVVITWQYYEQWPYVLLRINTGDGVGTKI